MKALVCHGRRDVRVERVPDSRIQFSTDAIIRITAKGKGDAGKCGRGPHGGTEGGHRYVHRGGTISISIAGVYGGMMDPMPMLVICDKHILRMGRPT